MKTIITVLLGGLITASSVYAYQEVKNAFYKVDFVKTGSDVNSITKYYDENANVICYRTSDLTKGALALSCLKNN